MSANMYYQCALNSVWLIAGVSCVQTNIPQSQIYAIKEGLPVKEAATEYEGQLLRIPENVLPRNSEGEPITIFLSPLE